MNKLNSLSRAEMKKVLGGVFDIGSPGGNNGNPCGNDGCQAMGGTLTAQYPSGTVLLGNCNEYPYSSGCHNACITPSGENVWC